MNRTLRVEISQQALIHNVNKIRGYAKGKAIIAMIKANAYGCGISNVWQALEGRVDLFGVASIEEALLLRKLGSNTPCLLMQGAVAKEDLQIAAINNFHCMVHNEEQLQWLTEINVLSKNLNIWIKIDTGMHRLGFDYKSLPKVVTAIEQVKLVKISGIITHMACADEVRHPKNQEQIHRFYTALSKHNKYPISISNSATILNFSDLEEDFVRPGIILYGISPLANSTGVSLGFLPVMRVTANIMSVKSYGKGETIGYGATYTCSSETKVGILPIGYGDGYPRHIAPNTPVFIKGQYLPIIGRVSMDMIAIDLTKSPEASLGDKAELWGLNLPVEKIAKAAGTIPYELICQLSTRVPKTII